METIALNRIWDFSDGYTANALHNKIFADPTWIIKGILPAGLTVIGGKPKIGKSWLSLNIALSVALGNTVLGGYEVDKTDCLYLALEDTPRRMQSRIRNCLQGIEPPSNLRIFHDWERIDSGGLLKLSAYLSQNSSTKLVVIDTLAKLWPNQRKTNGNGQTLYNLDYSTVGNLKTVADSFNAAILCIHHLRKTVSEDPLEQLSGSMGISGSADTIFILQRSRGESDATLLITGRDIEEQELAASFDQSTTTWKVVGTAKEYNRSREQVEVLEILRQSDSPLSPKQIATILNKNYDSVFKLLIKLRDEGVVKKEKYGKYIFMTPSTPSAPSAPCTPDAPSAPSG